MTAAPLPVVHGTAVDESLCRRIENLAASSIGLSSLVSWQPLNSQSRLRVARVSLTSASGGAPRSVIAKFVDPAVADAPRRGQSEVRYANERATYALLMRRRDRFDRFPQLLGQDGDLILLEDLGSQAPQPTGGLAPPLAETLVALHRATSDLTTADLEDTGAPERARVFHEAVERLADQAEILTKTPRARFETLAAMLEADVLESGPVTGLIHDDLADLRQTVWRPPSLYLIDFEYARIGDLCAELASILIGKAEFLLRPRLLLYNRVQLSADFLRLYRRLWREAGGVSVADDIWDRRLAAHLIHAALLVLPGFYRGAWMPSFTALARTQKLILGRVLELVPPGTAHADLIAVLAAIYARIV